VCYLSYHQILTGGRRLGPKCKKGLQVIISLLNQRRHYYYYEIKPGLSDLKPIIVFPEIMAPFTLRGSIIIHLPTLNFNVYKYVLKISLLPPPKTLGRYSQTNIYNLILKSAHFSANTFRCNVLLIHYMNLKKMY